MYCPAQARHVISPTSSMALPDHISHCTLLPSTMVVLQEAMAGKKPEGNEHKISKRKGEELTVSQVSLAACMMSST